jgi:hypothetical protein
MAESSGISFGIHILNYYPSFDPNWPTVMWNENLGPVQISFPTGQTWTVYQYGSRVMSAAAQLSASGYVVRIVSFNKDINTPTNSSSVLGSRTVSLGFQVRVPDIYGDIGDYYNFDQVNFETVVFGETKGSEAPSFTKTRSTETRDQVTGSIGSGQRVDLFQQTWTDRR